MSGRVMEVLDDGAGVQFYSGNFLDGTIVGKGGASTVRATGCASSRRCYPDAPNHPDFPGAGSIRARYVNMMVLRFSTVSRRMTQAHDNDRQSASTAPALAPPGSTIPPTRT